MRRFELVPLLAFTLCACAANTEPRSEDNDVELLGTALLQLTAVPIGVRCVEVGATGAGVVVTPVRVSVTTGGTAMAQLPSLPLTAVTFTADAYNEVCPATGTAFTTKKTWSALPVTKTLMLGDTALVELTLLAYDATKVGVGFELDAERISAGGFSTIVYHPDGTADMLGRGRTGSVSTTDLRVALRTMTDIVSVSVGAQHACAIVGPVPAVDNVRCWGRSTNGQAGPVGATFTTTPVTPVLGEPAISIAVGDAHSCAVLDSGKVKCWGSNSNGQLGTGAIGGADVPSTAPVAAALQMNAVVIANDVYAGGNTSCAVTGLVNLPTGNQQNPSGYVVCWGQNTNGQIGDGTQTDTGIGRIIANFNRIVDLAMTREAVLALMADGTVWGWGFTAGTGMPSAIAPIAPTGVVQLTPKQLVGLTNITDITSGSSSVGASFGCALNTAGAVQCWGAGALGQLAMKTTAGTTTPVTVPGVTGIQLASGFAHTCALTSDFRMFCWGGNSAGVFGEGTYDSLYVPTEVKGL